MKTEKRTFVQRCRRNAVISIISIALACLLFGQTLSASDSSSFSYPIVDTGQDQCYNNSSEITAPAAGEDFYGQDAQFEGNQPSYTKSADGLTVYDNVTGLTWTQSPDLNGDGNIDYDDKIFQKSMSQPVM